ncbi:MAG TPA: hypothetical protein VGG06_19100 [Thermoanaerobaculia bacterium]|jgi:hypothetical protein
MKRRLRLRPFEVLRLAPATDVPALSWYGAVALGLGLALAGWWTLRPR